MNSDTQVIDSFVKSEIISLFCKIVEEHKGIKVTDLVARFHERATPAMMFVNAEQILTQACSEGLILSVAYKVPTSNEEYQFLLPVGSYFLWED